MTHFIRPPLRAIAIMGVLLLLVVPVEAGPSGGWLKVLSPDGVYLPDRGTFIWVMWTAGQTYAFDLNVSSTQKCYYVVLDIATNKTPSTSEFDFIKVEKYDSYPGGSLVYLFTLYPADYLSTKGYAPAYAPPYGWLYGNPSNVYVVPDRTMGVSDILERKIADVLEDWKKEVIWLRITIKAGFNPSSDLAFFFHASAIPNNVTPTSSENWTIFTAFSEVTTTTVPEFNMAIGILITTAVLLTGLLKRRMISRQTVRL